jgi:hypothetical protein
MIQVFLANKPAALEALKPTHTVEAEFGEICVEGSVMTLAHHGLRSGNPCPCLARNVIPTGEEIVAISHLDLDTVGGLMAIHNVKPEASEFWRAAAAVDLKGVHKLHEITTDSVVLDQLNAFWAFAEANRVFPHREGYASRVTLEVERYMRATYRILTGDEEYLSAGRIWAASKRELDRGSLVEERGGVVLRHASCFTNHLYTPTAACVVALRTDNASVTVSLADPVAGVSCEKVVQELWGAGAGGHAGIAGSPRDMSAGPKDAYVAFEKMIEVLNAR